MKIPAEIPQMGRHTGIQCETILPCYYRVVGYKNGQENKKKKKKKEN